MKTSAAGLAFVAQEEGTVLHVYKDVAGYETIGIGHLLSPSEKASGVFAKGLTKQQAIDLLARDIVIYESAVNKNVKVPLTQNQFDALVSFAFNNGGGALASSGLLVKLNKGDIPGAADEFLRWCKVRINGELVTNQGLLNRRKRERTIFLKPDAVVPGPVPTPTPPPPPPPPPPVVIKPVPTPDPTPVPVEPAPPPVEPRPAPAPPAPIEPVKPFTLKSLIDFIVSLLRAFFGKGK
jgi:lysozyme